MLRGAGPKARPCCTLVSHAPSEPLCSLPGGGGGWMCKIPLGQRLSGRIFHGGSFPGVLLLPVMGRNSAFSCPRALCHLCLWTSCPQTPHRLSCPLVPLLY